MKLLMLLAFALVPSFLFSQSRKQRKAMEAQQKADQQVIGNFKNHVQYFISHQTTNSKPGAGTEITNYISDQFKLIGLQPKGNNGYAQQFKLELGKQISADTYLKVNGNDLVLNKDYVPLAYSASKKVTGMPAMALRERGVPWFADIKDWAEESSKDPEYNLNEVLQKEVAKAATKGAAALFLYNSSNLPDSLAFDRKDKTAPLSIPVVYIMADGYKTYFQDQEQILDIELNVAFEQPERTGKNVVGYVDNAAPSTIIVGASYDVTGNNSNTMNGARTAMLIELAKMLVVSPAKSNNYLFIAFSCEDVEAQGSNFWLQNTSLTTEPNYTINLDNVLAGDSKPLLGGYTTSPKWPEIIKTFQAKDMPVEVDGAIPPSTTFYSFYKKGIPVLNVYSVTTAAQEPATADELDYEKELQIAKFITRLVEATDKQGKLAFSETGVDQPLVKSPQSETTASTTINALTEPKTSVSLGVMADKTQPTEGLKINGVSPKKLAAKLGLQPGDILTHLGDYKIDDMASYLNALSNFKAGDKTTLGIKRGKEEKEFAVEF